jgi:hypothetical protein
MGDGALGGDIAGSSGFSIRKPPHNGQNDLFHVRLFPQRLQIFIIALPFASTHFLLLFIIISLIINK